MIKKERAQEIAHHWHGGQWSRLYSFASTGIIEPKTGLRLLKEIQECLEPEYTLYPTVLSIKDRKQLESLKRYVTTQLPYNVTWDKHPLYGYLIPYTNDASETLDKVLLLI